MKRLIPTLLLACCMISCLDTESHYTPAISLSYILNAKGDTVSVTYNSEADEYNIDSIILGDTIRFGVGFDALGNNLQYTGITWDDTEVKLWGTFGSTFANVLIEPSDTTKFELYYPEGYSYAAIPVRVVPLKEGSSSLKFNVRTDSKYSPVNETLNIKVIKLEADTTGKE